jgi:Zn-dependent peptidase ImmA (M78 family)
MQEFKLEQKFKATIVWLILDGKVEKALEILAKKHGVRVPSIEVGLPKKNKRKALGCYNGKNMTISVLNSDTLKDPFVILHEFYHHLRTTSDAKHRGTEKYANSFAEEYLTAYRTLAIQETGND